MGVLHTPLLGCRVGAYYTKLTVHIPSPVARGRGRGGKKKI